MSTKASLIGPSSRATPQQDKASWTWIICKFSCSKNPANFPLSLSSYAQSSIHPRKTECCFFGSSSPRTLAPEKPVSNRRKELDHVAQESVWDFYQTQRKGAARDRRSYHPLFLGGKWERYHVKSLRWLEHEQYPSNAGTKIVWTSSIQDQNSAALAGTSCSNARPTKSDDQKFQ